MSSDPLAPTPAPSWLTRIGLVVTSPLLALSIADDPRQPGRAGSDLALLLLLVIACAHTRTVVAATWVGASVGFFPAATALLAVGTEALTLPLTFVVVVAVGLWAAAGKARSLGRAFDVACVAAVPLSVVELSAAVGLATSKLPWLGGARVVLASLAFAVGGAIAAAAWRRLRGPAPPPLAVVPDVLRRGRRAGWMVLFVAALALAAHVTWMTANVHLLRPLTAGGAAPQFVLPTVDDGGGLAAPRALAETAGKVVVLDFWATWCGPCLQALPELGGIQETWAKKGVEVWAINVDDAEQARRYINRLAPSLTLLFDDADVAARYGVTRFPHTLVIDKLGKVREIHEGAGTAWIAPVLERLVLE